MTDEEKVRRAVKDLRATLRLTQDDFGTTIGKTTSTVQRYETAVPPRGTELTRLVFMAREANRPDLAKIFKESAISAVDEKLVTLIREGDIDGDPGEEATTEREGHKRRVRA